jgi:hypothetical protein
MHLLAVAPLQGPGEPGSRGQGAFSCDPRCMTATDPTGRSPQAPPDEGTTEPQESPSAPRAARFSYANMLRSLLPLVVICLVIVGWQAFQRGSEDPVREVDPTSTIRLAAERADYTLVVPTDLPDGYRPTSARTDAVDADEGAPITLEIGYVTPATEFAGFVISDDPSAEPVRSVLGGAREQGTVELGGATWTQSTTERGETALSLVQDGVTVLVSGSAGDKELETVAAALRPYSG